MTPKKRTNRLAGQLKPPKGKRRPLLTWRDLAVDVPTEADLAALQAKYGPPQPRDPLEGQPELLPSEGTP